MLPRSHTALRDIAVNERNHGVHLCVFNFLGEIGIDSAHSMPPVTAPHSTSTVARGLARSVWFDEVVATEF